MLFYRTIKIGNIVEYLFSVNAYIAVFLILAVLLSDIQIGSFVEEKQLQKIIEKVNKLDADLILISGDTFDVKAFASCNFSATFLQGLTMERIKEKLELLHETHIRNI